MLGERPIIVIVAIRGRLLCLQGANIVVVANSDNRQCVSAGHDGKIAAPIIDFSELSVMRRIWIVVSVKCLLMVLASGLLVSCTATSKSDGGRAIAQGLTYAQEFELVVEIIEEQGFREVDFDQEESKDAIAYLLHALDPGYFVLVSHDVEDLQEKYAGSVSSTDTRYSALMMVIEEFSAYSSMVMERDALDLLTAEPDGPLEVVNVAYNDWAHTDSELRSRWENVVRNDTSYYYQDGYEWPEIQEALTNYYSTILIQPMFLSDQEKFVLAANAALELVDSDSKYFVGEESTAMSSLSSAGIGLAVNWHGAALEVERVVVGGPADLDGRIFEGDEIIAIAQEGGEFVPISGLSWYEASNILHGEPGTTVRLKLRRGNLPIEVSVNRGDLGPDNQRIYYQVEEVVTENQSYKLGMITVPAFYSDFQAMRRKEQDYLSAARDMAQSLKELQAMSVDGVIIDLRNNGGGSIQEGNLIAGLFIEFGPVIQILHGKEKKVFRDGKRMRSDYYHGPLVVLVDQLSAGSSEIVAGVIQDYGAGIIVGHRTYGHGVVQTLIPMNEGQIALTVSELYRVTGVSYQINGVTPDIALKGSNHSLLGNVGQRFERNSIPPGEIHPVKTANYSKAPRELLEGLNKLHLERGVSDTPLETAGHDNVDTDLELYEAKNIAVDYIRALNHAGN